MRTILMTLLALASMSASADAIQDRQLFLKYCTVCHKAPTSVERRDPAPQMYEYALLLGAEDVDIEAIKRHIASLQNDHS